MARRPRINVRHPRGLTAAWLISGLAAIASCARSEPPTPAQDPTYAPLPKPAGSSTPVGSAVATSSAAPLGSATDRQTSDAGAAAQEDPGKLPQTKDRPAPSSPALTARARALFDAIVHDEPERAMPFFFPLGAYEQVKAIGNPEGDWRRRLVGAYTRDIHNAHKKLGDRAATATFVSLDVQDEAARWVNPGEEGNKLGYFRVYNTRIKYSVAGETGFIDLKSLISWRGEWYIVHLAGFK